MSIVCDAIKSLPAPASVWITCVLCVAHGPAGALKWWVEDFNSTYVDNQAQAGGAAYLEPLYSPAASFTQCTLYRNVAARQGGAVSIAATAPGPALLMTACNMSSNDASAGGAAQLLLQGGSSATFKVAGQPGPRGTGWASNPTRGCVARKRWQWGIPCHVRSRTGRTPTGLMGVAVHRHACKVPFPHPASFRPHLAPPWAVLNIHPHASRPVCPAGLLAWQQQGVVWRLADGQRLCTKQC